MLMRGLINPTVKKPDRPWILRPGPAAAGSSARVPAAGAKGGARHECQFVRYRADVFEPVHFALVGVSLVGIGVRRRKRRAS